MCVTSLTTGLSGACAAVKKAGGVKETIYAGSVKDIASITYDATDGFISAITMATGKEMVALTGRIEKNTASEPITAEGEGNVNIYVHTVQPVLYHSTQADRNAIEELFALDKAFFIIPMRSGQYVVYGLAKEDYPFIEFGLKLAEGDDTVGIQLNDQNAQTATMSGNMLHKALMFMEGETEATIQTALGVLTTPAV